MVKKIIVCLLFSSLIFEIKPADICIEKTAGQVILSHNKRIGDLDVTQQLMVTVLGAKREFYFSATAFDRTTQETEKIELDPRILKGLAKCFDNLELKKLI